MSRAIRHNNGADYPLDVIAHLLVCHAPDKVAGMIATRSVFVLIEGEHIVGTAALEGQVLRGLFVEVDSQGRGLARLLIRYVEARACAQGLVDLELQSSTTAHGLYQRLGYRTQAFRYHPEGSTYRMVKRLA